MIENFKGNNMLVTQEIELQQVVSIPEMIENLNKVIADYPNVDPTKMFVKAYSNGDDYISLVVTFAREATEKERLWREARTQRETEARREHYESLKKEFEGG